MSVGNTLPKFPSMGELKRVGISPTTPPDLGGWARLILYFTRREVWWF